MKVREHPIGFIIDNIKSEEMDWMIYSPYEDALYRMNQETVEAMVLEFIEMIWSVETDYRSLEILLKTKFIKTNSKQGIIIESSIDKNVILYLKRLTALLESENEYIQELNLFVSKQPDLKLLKQKLDDISKEFDVKQEENFICIEWIRRKVIVQVS